MSEDQIEVTEEELDAIADTAIAALHDILKYFNAGEVTIDEGLHRRQRGRLRAGARGGKDGVNHAG